MKLELSKIRLDGGTQPRAAIDEEIVREYAELMQAGVEFRAVEVFFDGSEYWLTDGFHRVAAAKCIGVDEIECDVVQGTLTDAQWHSYGVNKAHGLRRKIRDKERAVRAALAHPKSQGLSDSAIAEHVGVSQPFVGKIRKKMAATYNGYKSTARTGRDGRTIDTTRIGRSRPASWRRRDTPSRHMAGRISQPTRVPRLMERMTALSMPHNPVMGARTLIEIFDTQYLRALVKELTIRLDELETQRPPGVLAVV